MWKGSAGTDAVVRRGATKGGAENGGRGVAKWGRSQGPTPAPGQPEELLGVVT